MADVLTWFLLITGSILVLNAYWLAAISLAPRLVDKCHINYRRPLLITALGLLTAAPFLAVAILLGRANNPALKALAFLCVAPGIVFAMTGSAGLARKVGEGLPSTEDDKQPWRRVLRGGIVVALTLLLPLIGWFILFPWTLISGLGAVTLTLWNRRKARAPTQHEEGQPHASAAAQPVMSGMATTSSPVDANV
ncbi:MAG: hypothetical protein L0Y58_15010 [Verrucomicrobia subdivision 3 bacterium]|nr:hypothetical protein [Limisphaerales bacterium]